MKLNLYSFALGFVFFIFGLWQLIQPNYWLAYLPLWTKNFNQNLLIIFNGFFDLVIGIALIFDFFPLIFSALAFFHLLLVIINLGILNDIAIRDFGLLLLALAIFIDNLKKKNKNL